jgi:flagellin-specific chaperone FliS
MAVISHPEVAEYYAKVQIETATMPRVVCMLHDKCVQFISAALDTPPERRGLAAKAQNILFQLQMSLKDGDAISQSLFLLYDYCYVQLDRGADENLYNAGKLIAVLRDTFKYLAKRPRRNQ